MITIQRFVLGAAITGGLGLVFLILLAVVGMGNSFQYIFGTLNDIANAVMAVLGVILVSLLFMHYRSQLQWFHPLFLGISILGRIVAVWGSILIISGRSGFILAGLYSAAGYGLIGLWLFTFNLAMRGNGSLNQGIVTFGIITGFAMILGLGGLPSLFRNADAFDQIPMVEMILWSIGSLAWLILQPIWYYLLSRGLVRAG